MPIEGTEQPARRDSEPVIFERLHPDAGPVSAADYVRDIGLWDRPPLGPGRVPDQRGDAKRPGNTKRVKIAISGMT